MRLRWFGITAVVMFALCATLPTIATADMEVRVPLTHVSYESSGIDGSGPIKANVFQGEHGIYKLTVSAFGSIRTVAKPQLEAIDGKTFNSVGVSYSRGYRDVGGRTVYLLLYQAFSTGSRLGAMVVIREHGASKVVMIGRWPQR